MKLKELVEGPEHNTDDLASDMDPTQGGGFKSDGKTDKRKLTSHYLRRKAEKNNPLPGDNTAPDNSTTGNSNGDDPDDSHWGAGLQ